MFWDVTLEGWSLVSDSVIVIKEGIGHVFNYLTKTRSVSSVKIGARNVLSS